MPPLGRLSPRPCGCYLLDGMKTRILVVDDEPDVVDALASHRVGALLRSYPKPIRKYMLEWSRSDDMWKRRTSIICQLGFKQDTDLPLLYACIEPSLDSTEFFLRKAIGWALRQYAWTDPQEICRYVQTHDDRLSPLSKREALKNIISKS